MAMCPVSCPVIPREKHARTCTPELKDVFACRTMLRLQMRWKPYERTKQREKFYPRIDQSDGYSAQHKSQLVVKQNISLSLSILCELSHQGKDYLALLSLRTDDPFLGFFGRLALAAHVSQKLCLLDLISVHKRSGSRCQGQPKLPALCPLDCVFEKEASARTAAPAVLYLAH
jgi:hypothetical protein